MKIPDRTQFPGNPGRKYYPRESRENTIDGYELLDRVLFKNCTDEVRKIIEMVVEYMQESM